MRFMLATLLSSALGFQYVELPQFVTQNDAQKIIDIAKQSVAHPQISADFLADQLGEFVMDPKVLTEADLENLEIDMTEKELEEFNSIFFQKMQTIINEKLPLLQQKIREEEGSL